MLYHNRLSVWLSSCLSEIFALANVNQQAQFLLRQIHEFTFLSGGKGISFSANKCHRKLKLPAEMAGQLCTRFIGYLVPNISFDKKTTFETLYKKFGVTYIS